MRGIAALCVLIGCSPDHDGHAGIDAPRGNDGPTADASSYVCRSLAGTASVLVDNHGASQTWTRLDAGGILNGGPLLGGPPMSLWLLFTDTDPLDGQVGQCCESPHSGCCTVNGLRAMSQPLTPGNEVGQHPVMVGAFDDSFTFDGMLTITYFANPFDTSPGRITGSIAGSVAGQSVSGQFDNTFCSALLTETI